MLNKVWEKLQTWPEWLQSRRIVLAISGGVDSMVLLDVLLRINNILPDGQGKEYIIAHFNHHLRDESHLDAQLIKDYLRDYQGIYFYGHWTKPANSNVESQAREARYRFLADVIHGTEADSLMTAHHLNDGAETMLMRLIRGSSIKGISGIEANYERLLETSSHHTISVNLMRPFINISKEEIYQYAQNFQVPYLEDASNYQNTYLRNRIRHQLIPYLEQENPQFLSNLMFLSKQLAASYQAHFQAYLKVEPNFATMINREQWLIYIPELLKLSPQEIQIYLLIFFEERLIYQIPNYNKAILIQFQYMVNQITSPNMTLELGGTWRAIRSYDYVLIKSMDATDDNSLEIDQIIIENLNQWVHVSNQESLMVVDKKGLDELDSKEDYQQVLPLNIQEFKPLCLRRRQNGDSLHLERVYGQTYHKKVSRILIDQKVPSLLRDQFWVLENSDHEVLVMLPHIAKDKIYENPKLPEKYYLVYRNYSQNLLTYANIVKYNEYL